MNNFSIKKRFSYGWLNKKEWMKKVEILYLLHQKGSKEKQLGSLKNKLKVCIFFYLWNFLFFVMGFLTSKCSCLESLVIKCLIIYIDSNLLNIKKKKRKDKSKLVYNFWGVALWFTGAVLHHGGHTVPGIL